MIRNELIDYYVQKEFATKTVVQKTKKTVDKRQKK